MSKPSREEKEIQGSNIDYNSKTWGGDKLKDEFAYLGIKSKSKENSLKEVPVHLVISFG